MVRVVCVFLLYVSLVVSCTSKYSTYATHYPPGGVFREPDYSRLDSWAAHPWKKDPSDSVPSPLRYEEKDSLADVFFIYPTTYTGTKKGWNAEIDDPNLNAKTDYSTILYQASAFNKHARVFSPRYRQAHLSAFFIDNDDTKAAFDTAYADVRNAFQFYLDHYYKDQPLIIAGHSQGAKMAERLLLEFFDGKPLQQKLVAAYIIGWPIPQNYFKQLPVCKDSVQTGCFCGWRTLKKGYVPDYMAKEKIVSYVTNPLSWTTDTEFVPASRNLGSVLRDFDEVIPATTGAAIHGGVLWVSRPKFPGSVFFRTRNYHIADINLFYMNLRRNIECRLRNFISLQ
jgi:hypothetical protein